jgi:hypothetical protein
MNFPAVRGDAEISTNNVVDGVHVNIIAYIPSSKNFGSPLKKRSWIGVEGASYIYSFKPKSIYLKVKYASPLIEKQGAETGSIHLSLVHITDLL